ncbi:hypothetical protein PInf_004705 [Phytophthora infestans]|nr:hypothetical protein PInf_004705 [Phytophthora infestans]
MDDKADEDLAKDEDEAAKEDQEEQPDFCFDINSDDTFFGDRNGTAGAIRVSGDVPSISSPDSDASRRDESPCIEGAGDLDSNAAGRLGRAGMHPSIQDGLEAFATMTSSAPTQTASHQPRPSNAAKCRKVANAPVVPSAPASTSDTTSFDPKAGSRDEQDASRHKKQLSFSNRLGGSDSKRAHDNDEKDMM